MTSLDLSHRPLSSFNEAGVQTVWNATSISLVQTCMRKYAFKMLDGVNPKGLNANLRFGGHYATALEHYFKHVALGMSPDDAVCEVVREAMVNTWDHEACEACDGSGMLKTYERTEVFTTCSLCGGSGHKPDTGHPWESGDNLKTRDNLIRSIVWYLDHFKNDAAPVMVLADGKPAVELSAVLEVDNGIMLAAHLDRVVEYADHPYVQDQKTTKQTIGPYYFDQYKPHTQMSLYTFLGKAVFGVPVKGVMIDAAQIAVGFTRFERNFTFRTDDELTEWYDNAMYWIVEAQNAFKLGGYDELYRRANPASCGNYGGCEFRLVCSKSPDVRKQFLLGNYETGPIFDPLAQR